MHLHRTLVFRAFRYSLGLFILAFGSHISQVAQAQTLNPLSADPTTPIAEQKTRATAPNGQYISWVEHIIDDPDVGPDDLSGSDGLEMADLDGDGYEDVVSVHESDTTYHGKPIGHVRIAWGTAKPHVWELSTLAAGPEAAAAEDVSITDANGLPDIIVAAELAHLIYFQNPGGRNADWPRKVIPLTTNRGSYIRVFFADFDGDGHPEVVTPNKGAQSPAENTPEKNNISIFHLPKNPLQGELWREQLLTRVRVPINSVPVDLDADGDLDVVAGSRAEARILWLENKGDFNFHEHAITPSGLPDDAALTDFNMAYADLNHDGRIDIVSTAWPGYLVLLTAPKSYDQPWSTTLLGHFLPDQLVSVTLSDIDGDGDLDAFAGSYSRGLRDQDDPSADRKSPLGRIGWFENPGEIGTSWTRHDISRRKRGMYDKWLARDLDQDGDMDFIGTRGNSTPFDGVIWLQRRRSSDRRANFTPAREKDSQAMGLP